MAVTGSARDSLRHKDSLRPRYNLAYLPSPEHHACRCRMPRPAGVCFSLGGRDPVPGKSFGLRDTLLTQICHICREDWKEHFILS